MRPTTISKHDLLERKEELLRRRLLHTLDEIEGRGEVVRNATSVAPLVAGTAVMLLAWFAASVGIDEVKRWQRRRRSWLHRAW